MIRENNMLSLFSTLKDAVSAVRFYVLSHCSVASPMAMMHFVVSADFYGLHTDTLHESSFQKRGHDNRKGYLCTI